MYARERSFVIGLTLLSVAGVRSDSIRRSRAIRSYPDAVAANMRATGHCGDGKPDFAGRVNALPPTENPPLDGEPPDRITSAG
jgi:hypothetical protein